MEYTPSFNPIALKDSALSTHKPIEVKGPGGKATIVHAQYNTPISMYSQDAIMDAIAGQSQAKGHDRWGHTSANPLSSLFFLSFSLTTHTLDISSQKSNGPRFEKSKGWFNQIAKKKNNADRTMQMDMLFYLPSFWDVHKKYSPNKECTPYASKISKFT